MSSTSPHSGHSKVIHSGIGNHSALALMSVLAASVRDAMNPDRRSSDDAGHIFDGKLAALVVDRIVGEHEPLRFFVPLAYAEAEANWLHTPIAIVTLIIHVPERNNARLLPGVVNSVRRSRHFHPPHSRRIRAARY